MSHKGNCWGNTVAESFFATLKKELIYRQNWNTAADVDIAVFEYIEGYYNRKRVHSALGYRTPESVENDVTNVVLAAQGRSKVNRGRSSLLPLAMFKESEK